MFRHRTRHPRFRVMFTLLGIALVGNAFAAPVIDLSRTSIYSRRVKGGISAPVQPIFVTNTGDAPLMIQALALDGTNASDFVVSGTCSEGGILGPKSRCRIDIVLTPASAELGERAATLTVVTNAPVPAPVVQLSGTGSPDALPLVPTPPYLDFDGQSVGTASQARTFSITNPNSFSASVTDVGLGGANPADFTFDTNCPAHSFLTGSKCTATIVFAPTAAGPRSAVLHYSVAAFRIPDALEISVTGIATGSAVATNYQGLWWASPPSSESGWGINFAHQGDIIFATWFTYGADGKPLWFAATFNKTAAGVYGGDVITVAGVPFDSVPWDTSKVVETTVGTMTVTFANAGRASMAYTVNGITQTKAIVPQQFAVPPVSTCVWGVQTNLALATNFQDLWWAAPAGRESG